MIVIIKRLFKFGDKFYKVGKYEAPELYQDHWFLESLIEQGFLTLASIAQKTAAVAKEIEKVAESVDSIAETVEEIAKRGRPKKEAATPEV